MQQIFHKVTAILLFGFFVIFAFGCSKSAPAPLTPLEAEKEAFMSRCGKTLTSAGGGAWESFTWCERAWLKEPHYTDTVVKPVEIMPPVPMPAHGEPDKYATQGWSCKRGFIQINNICEKKPK